MCVYIDSHETLMDSILNEINLVSIMHISKCLRNG